MFPQEVRRLLKVWKFLTAQDYEEQRVNNWNFDKEKSSLVILTVTEHQELIHYHQESHHDSWLDFWSSIHTNVYVYFLRFNLRTAESFTSSTSKVATCAIKLSKVVMVCSQKYVCQSSKGHRCIAKSKWYHCILPQHITTTYYQLCSCLLWSCHIQFLNYFLIYFDLQTWSYEHEKLAENVHPHR